MSDSEQELISSCISGNFLKVKKLLHQGINPNTKNITTLKQDLSFEGKSALCIAASEGHLEVTKLLLEYGANVNYRCKNGESALFLAAQKGFVKISECLLKAGAKVAYTANTGDNVFLEHWEVFTQALRDVYPRKISDPEYTEHKAVVQLLLENNANSQRPSTLYEMLYCSLTVFANPIAVYCVGVYAELSSDHPAVVFSEDNFLSALCHAYDFQRAKDFLYTVQCILSGNRARQTEVAQSLIRNFNWADLVKRLSEQAFQNSSSTLVRFPDTLLALFTCVNNIASNINVRSSFQNQFAILTADDLSKIGRLIKWLLDFVPNQDKVSSDCVEAWKFLFFLLKLYLRENQRSHVSRLLLRSTSQKDTSTLPSKSTGAEFEKMILSRCVEDDIALAHMLIDFGVAVTGSCFVNFVKQGHVDLVDRCSGDKDLLFSKEVGQLLQTPIAVRNSSNRNMRRCIKIIKNQRNTIERLRSELEKELLMDDCASFKATKKKQRQQAKKQRNAASGDASKTTPFEKCESKLNGTLVSLSDTAMPQNVPEDELSDPSEKTQLTESEEGNEENCTFAQEKQKSTQSKSKKRKKNKKKNTETVRNAIPDATDLLEDDKFEQLEDFSSNTCEEVATSDTWKDVMLETSRRRRQSSSSSDCSTGPRKSVHFSHPLAFYENVKPKARLGRVPSNDAVPKASNLKQTVATEKCFQLSETYRTNDIATNGCFSHFERNIPWIPRSIRWVARFEDLSESELDYLKQFNIPGADSEKVFFCDKQRHLNIGSGPDFSNTFLGLTSEGKEIAIKKIGSKRLPALNQKEINALLQLQDHHSINKYHTIIKDKSHYFIIQDVRDYSLEQLIRKKLKPFPLTAPKAFQQLAKGLEFLHSNAVLHMAIKPANILLDEGNNLRLCDYGIHRRESGDNKKNPLAPTISCMCWMARECAPTSGAKANFTAESDIKSLGMIFFYILTGGSHPFGNPESSPRECIKNISKGTFSLSPLTDALAYDLIKNMILKEPGKRFKMTEILSHPYLWSDEDKDAYFTLLVETALVQAQENGKSIIKLLEPFQKELMVTYVRRELLVEVHDKFSSLEALLTFLSNCMNDSDFFKRHSKSSVAATMSAVRYLQMCFPGLLIRGHKVVTWDDLENTSLKCDVFKRYRSKPVVDEDIPSDFEQEDTLVKSILGCCEKNQNDFSTASVERRPGTFQTELDDAEKLVPEADDLDLNGLKKNDPLWQDPFPNEITKTQKPLYSFAPEGAEKTVAKEWKNKNLCLMPEQAPVGTAAIEDKTPSPTNFAEDILFGFGLEPFAKARENNCQSSNHVMAKSCDPVLHATSPDDWIEVGSPLRSVFSPSAPIDYQKNSAGALSDDNSSGSSSSACSVDGCYDFDGYVQNWIGSPEVELKKPDFSSHSSHVFVAYTDLDELD